MKRDDLSRRDFHKLTMAAFGGVVAGSALGCNKEAPAPPAPAKSGTETSDSGAEDVDVAIHACRGMNECKGQGASGDNACAGQGTCASAAAHHECAGQNTCKNLGGCGENAGANECKGQGGCSVPMHEGAWERARAAFEERMQKAGKEVGAAPPRA